MNTRSTSMASKTTTDMNDYHNTLYILEDPTQEERIPSWARSLIESLEALAINVQTTSILIDRLGNTLKNLEPPNESDYLEDNSPQIEISKEPISDHLDFSNFVPSNDYYLRDMTDYKYNEVQVDIPMFKEVDDPKEYLNEDMISSLPNTIQSTNPTPRANSIIRYFKCRKVGHVKADCLKLIIVMDDSNPFPTNNNKEFELEDEIYGLDKAISIKHVHIIHDIVLKEFASSYERFKTFIAFPRRYKILKPSDFVYTKIHPPKLLKFSFKFQLKNYVPSKLLLKLSYIICPFTLKEFWVLGSKIKTDPLSYTSRISYGPSHLERNFPGKSLRREL